MINIDDLRSGKITNGGKRKEPKRQEPQHKNPHRKDC